MAELRGPRAGPGARPPPGRWHRVRTTTWVLCLVAVLAGVRTFVVVPVSVDGTSMEPTVHGGGVALVWRLIDAPRDLRRGDLIVFHDPEGALSLKRVIGLPGDSVALRDAALEVNGSPVEEPYLNRTLITSTYFGPVAVPDGRLFVLGDNRARSVDSRDYGAIDAGGVVGRVLLHP